MSVETFRKILVIALVVTAPIFIGVVGAIIGLLVALVFWTFFPIKIKGV